MPEYVETADDLTRKYGRAYVKYKNELVYVKSFDTNRDGAVLFYYTDGRNGEQEVLWDNSFIEEIAIKRGFYNLGNLPCVKLSRTSAKQWRRSFSQDNVNQYYPSLIFYELCGFPFPYRAIAFGFKELKQIVTPEFPDTLEMAVKTVLRTGAVAISPELALCINPFSETDFLVSNLTGFVGTYSPKKGITIHHEPMFQEISDICRRNNSRFNCEVSYNARATD